MGGARTAGTAGGTYDPPPPEAQALDYRGCKRQEERSCSSFYSCLGGVWAAADGGVRGVWPPFLEIGLVRPFLPEQHLGAFSLRCRRFCLIPHLLTSHLRNFKAFPCFLLSQELLALFFSPSLPRVLEQR